jgi:hypothetical protein
MVLRVDRQGGSIKPSATGARKTLPVINVSNSFAARYNQSKTNLHHRAPGEVPPANSGQSLATSSRRRRASGSSLTTADPRLDVAARARRTRHSVCTVPDHLQRAK